MAARSDLTSPRTPRGFADRGAAELAATREMVEAIRRTYELWGFEAVETPFLEYTDALGKFLPDQDRPNAGVFSLKDDDEQWLSLRYDLTAPLARHVAENYQKLAKPYRSYRFGPVFRNEKPGPGRFRQFLQFDADIVGAGSVAADAEMCMMMADTLEAVGVKRGDYVIKVNNRKILDGVMDWLGLSAGNLEARDAYLWERRLTVLRALDKFDRLKEAGVRALLGQGRLDESGAYTLGANLDPDQVENLLWLLTIRSELPNHRRSLDTGFNPKLSLNTPEGWVEHDMLTAMENSAYRENETYTDGLSDLRKMERAIVASGYNDGRIQIDPSVVRGLEYYTGPVYEAELTFEIPGDDGKPIRFGSVGGGGRYDGLVGRFMAEDVPATGFSIGVSRLQAALAALKSEDAKPAPGPVVVLVLDRDRIGDSMALAARLRAQNIAAEVYLGASGMKAQMKYADRRRSPCVVIQGSDEREKGEVTLKDLVAGAKAAAAIADRAEWTESRPAQVTVADAEFEAKVREILDGQA